MLSFLLAGMAATTAPMRAESQESRPELVLQQGHSASLYSFSADNRILATAGFEDVVDIWEVSTGQILRFIQGTENIADLEFSPDSRHLAVARQHYIEIWDFRSGELIRKIETRLRYGIRSITWSPDGRFLAACGEQARIWDAKTGQLKKILPSHSRHSISKLVFSPDGRQVATDGSRVDVWDFNSGKIRRTISWESADDLAFTKDSKTLITLRAGNIWPWRITDGKLLRLPNDTPSDLDQRGFMLSADGRTALRITVTNQTPATTSPEKTTRLFLSRKVTLYDTHTFKPQPVPEAIQKWLEGSSAERMATLSPIGDLAVLVPSSEIGPATVWNLKSGSRLFDLPSYSRSPVFPLMADLGQVFSLAQGERLFWWNFAQSLETNSLALPSEFGDLRPGIASGSIQWSIFDPAKRQVQWYSMNLNTSPPLPTPISVPDVLKNPRPLQGTLDYGGLTRDGNLGIYHSDTGQLEVFEFPKGNSLREFSPDRTTAAISSPNGDLKLWNFRTGESCDVIAKSPTGIEGVIFTPDGNHLAFRKFESRELTIMDVSTRQVIGRRHNAGPFESLQFSPDSRRIAYVDLGQVLVWDLVSQSQILSAPVEQDAAFCFSASGKTLIVTEPRGAVELWDIPTGQLRVTLQALYAPSAPEAKAIPQDWLAYTPDGYYAGGTKSSSTIRWRVGDQLFKVNPQAAEFNRPDLVLQALREN